MPEIIPEYLRRYATTPARESLAQKLGLPFSPSMQDWEWEVADPSLISPLLALYQAADVSEAERFSLMECLVQSVADVETPQSGVPSEWPEIAGLLRADPRLHASTLEYWSGAGEDWNWPGIGAAMAAILNDVRDRLS